MKFLPSLLWLTIAALPCHAESNLTFSSGADYSSGKYGDSEKTETYSIPLGLKYEFSEWTLRASIPYVRSSGPANVVGQGADRITLNSGQNVHRTVTGFGDMVISANWTALQHEHWLVEIGAKLKLPTGKSSDGLGTGEPDYSLQTEVYRSQGKHTLFGTLGIKKMGDPAGIDLKDPLYLSLGGSMRVAPDTSFGVSYDFRQKIQEGGAPLREATAFATRKLDANWKIQAYAVTGFSRASPDWGGGLLAFFTY
ncbi:MAG: hypothetical protein ACM3X0_13110 [Bacteroidota bacterium]